MLKRLRPHLSYANVISSLALFLVLAGGTAAAVDGSLPGQNTVGSADIIDREVKASDIGSGVVNSGHVANESLSGTDIANATIGIGDLNPAARGARAYGTVTYDGHLSRDKGVTGVAVPGGAGIGNIYCIALASYINPATATLVISPDLSNASFSTANAYHPFAMSDSRNDNCPTGQLEVDMYLDDGDTTDNNDGSGDFPGDHLDASPEPFTFVVP